MFHNANVSLLNWINCSVIHEFKSDFLQAYLKKISLYFFFRHPEVPLLSDKDVYVAFMPFFHMYGIMAILNLSLIGGSTTVVLPRFDLEEYLRTVEKYKVYLTS